MTTPRLQFLLCGRPDDAFMSQVAMFRLALDDLGGAYREAGIAMSLDRFEPVPDRWRAWLDRVDFHYAPHDHFDYVGNVTAVHADTRLHSYSLIDPAADVCIVCDADTLLLRAFEPRLLEALAASAFIGGAIAHFPPPRTDSSGHDWQHLSNQEFWNEVGRRVIGRDVPTRHFHSLSRPPIPCPFYINYGLVVSTPELLRRLSAALRELQPRVREFMDNWFFSQIAVALAVESLGLPVKELPLRYNYPNDAYADSLYPGEVEAIMLLHYQRSDHFDRHRIFASESEFMHFLSLDLQGSNAVFQGRVRELTGGRYPFA